MTTRFNDPMGTAPALPLRTSPTADQIAATGAALPAGAHQLSDAQQRAWFGGVVFAAPVAWEEGRGFVSAGGAFTPDQVHQAAQAGQHLGQNGGAQ
jgi:hypothetical protein